MLLPSSALAEADVFGLGDGHHGSLTVRDPGTTLNPSTVLLGAAAAGATELQVEDTTGLLASDLVMVLQMARETPLAQDRTLAELDLSQDGTGRWEFARVTEVADGGVLRLSAPLLRRYPAEVTQVVKVPEYSDVAIRQSGSLAAPLWDGRKGGVLALLVTGVLFNQGEARVDGAGFLGGAGELEAQNVGCDQDDAALGGGGGTHKGEGISSPGDLHDSHGYLRIANGGGGGNCRSAGGGGGGNAGQGGQGGYTTPDDSSRDVGGRGGAALKVVPEERLLLGGGGGAGAGGSDGGRGGGILFIRAREIRGPAPRGVLSANGMAAGQAAGANGAGGGGAGGTVHVRVAEKLSCTLLDARGGAGGPGGGSPGGGGGGGYVFIQAPGVDAACTVSGDAGPGGRVGEDPRGATPQDVTVVPHAGAVTNVPIAFAAPAAPTFVFPTEGATGVVPLPRLEGTTTPGASVVVVLDGVELPPVVADAEGKFSLVPPTELAEGAHQVSARAVYYGMQGAASKQVAFSVGLLKLAVGCGCDGAGGALPWLGALGVLGLVLTRPKRQPSEGGRGTLTAPSR